jgi:endonuclease YncB( thermonuclease family)
MILAHLPAFVFALLMLGFVPAAADSGGRLTGLDFVGEATAVDVEAGGVLMLDDRRRAVLAGIELPRRPLSVSRGADWPAEEQARSALAGLASGGPLRLYGGGRDRYNRLLVHAFTADGRWLQEELLRLGWARVATTRDSHDRAGAMLTAEAAARENGRGIWALPAYAVRRPGETWTLIDSVQVVEGRVSSTNLIRGTLYVNLGDEWRRRLGLRVPPSVIRAFARHPPLAAFAGNPQALTGRRLRVRGWIGKGAGPLIEVSHPEQIELLADAGRPPRRAAHDGKAR